MRHEYSTDVEGGAPVSLRFAISGRLNVPDYLAFIADRARWLDIAGWAAPDGPGAVTLVAAGPEALVGALEMACTLGPLNALVDRVDAVEAPWPDAGFFLRQ